MSYKNIDWTSLNFARSHLYRHFANPINNALGRLAIARHVERSDETDEQLRYVEHNLERALNLIRAWAALIHVQNGGAIAPEQRRTIGPDDLPRWLTMYLNMQTGVHLDHSAPVFVHPETYYEGILLLWQVGQTIGGLKHITTTNAARDGQSIWLRAIFDPPPTGYYSSLNTLVEQLNQQQDYDTLVQVMVLGDLFAINGADLRLQNNKRSGEQALAVSLPSVPDDLPDEAEGDDFFTSVLNHVNHLASDGLTAQETIFSQVIRELDADTGTPAPASDDADATDTLMVPPPTLKERLAALDQQARTAQETDAVQDTNAVQDAATRAALDAPQAAGDASSENDPDTLMVPPPGFRERLAAITQTETQPPASDNVPRAADQDQAAPPDAAQDETNQDQAHQQPGVPNGDIEEDIEIVPPRQATDTDIVPPPEVQRRLLERKARHDPRSSESAQPGIEPEASNDPNGDDSPSESVERDR